MRGPERVIHVDLGQRGERAREGRVVLFLLGVEPEVLEQHELRPARRLRRSTRLLAPRTDPVGCERHRAPSNVADDCGHRLQAELRAGLALRPAQVRGQDDRGARVERVPDGRQRRGDARVVGDVPLFIGTLKSTRTKTRLPASARSRIEYLVMVNEPA